MCNRYRPASITYVRDVFGFTYIESGPDIRELKPAIGPLQMGHFVRGDSTLLIGQWGLTPDGSQTLKPTFTNGRPMSTNNCRFDVMKGMPEAHSFRGPWMRQQRCLVFVQDYDEPCYAVNGKNIWWRFARADGQPWALAGLWNQWIDPEGEIHHSYTMFTINCNAHPLLSLMHKPDLDADKKVLPFEKQDKRTVVPIEREDWNTWLTGTPAEAAALMRLPALERFKHGPADPAVDAVLPL